MEKLRRTLKKEYDSKVIPVKEHLEKVNQHFKSYLKKKMVQENELTLKRNELLKTTHLL